MNWEVITAVSTIAGVIGGLVSVYFLIHEVRRNSLAIEGAAVQSLMTFEQAVFALLIDNAATFLAGTADRDTLSRRNSSGSTNWSRPTCRCTTAPSSSMNRG